ncbi:hypothetical protein ACFL5W_01760 [Thermodesulfobacteriota bacterium]
MDIETAIPLPIVVLRYFWKIGLLNINLVIVSFVISIISALIVVILFYYLLKLFRANKPVTTKKVLIPLGLIGLLLLFNLNPLSILLSRYYFAKGFLSNQIGKPELSKIFIERALKLDPKLSIAFDLQVNNYQMNYDNYSMIKKLENIAFGNNDLSQLEKIAKLYKNAGDYKRAITLYDLLISKNINERRFRLSIAELLIKQNKYKHALEYIDGLEDKDDPQLNYYKSLIKYNMDFNDESYEHINIAISSDYNNYKYWVLLGHIRVRMNNASEAIRCFLKATELKRDLPEGYAELAKLYYRIGNKSECAEYLRKALYYNNKLSYLYVYQQCIINGIDVKVEEIKKDKIDIKLSDVSINLNKNETVKVNYNINLGSENSWYKTAILKPYGFGVSIKAQSEIRGTLDSNNYIKGTIEIIGLRDNKINIGKSWQINLIVYDVNQKTYNNAIVNINVKDENEGKVLFVITEDLEQSSDFPHRNDATPKEEDLDINEVLIDLIEKPKIADRILNKYNAKWSHIIDIGSAFTRVKWLSKKSSTIEWKDVWENLKEYYSETIKQGNDIQLHLHAYNLPHSDNFSQKFDNRSNQLIFSQKKSYKDGHRGAWSNQYIKIGDFKLKNTKIGSIKYGIEQLERELCKKKPSYRTIFFRAGEYEFGIDKKSVRESIISLRKNKILASSNSYFGKFGTRSFTFSRSLKRNAYLTSYDNIREPSSDILDIGVLELVPLQKIGTMYYIEPTDNPKSILKYYNSLTDRQGNIEPGIHILMEMYHMFTFNYKDKWDSVSENYGDWNKLNKHFKTITTHCEKAEFVTISDAVLAYLDYYTPQLICLRTNEKKINDRVIEYDIKFIGEDIQINEGEYHYGYIKPPVYHLDKITKIVLYYDNKIDRVWDNIQSYNDLEFKIKNKLNYKMKVYL